MDGLPLDEAVPFYVGLKKAVEWYEEHPVGETFTHLGELGGKLST
jgi:hypothetical protein